jgi:hypothetical protein
MLKMRKTLYLFFLLTARLMCIGQTIELTSFKVTLPQGNVLGVALDSRKDRFFVQQLALSSGEGGRGVFSTRQFSSWSLKSRTQLTNRMLDPNPRHVDRYPCGRVEVSLMANRIFLCSSETHLEILEPDTLVTVGKLAYSDDRQIYDFAVDDQRGRVFVLSLRHSDGSVRLTSYSLLDGVQQQDSVLPPTGGSGMVLALVPETGQVVVAVDSDSRGKSKSDIYVCISAASLTCVSVALLDRVSQTSMLGKELLVATSTFADRKNECLISIDLSTHAIARKYCSPATGVHYAVGVAADRYIVAFTGTGRRLWWKEQNVVVENSFSVWKVGNPQVAAVAKDPTNYGGVQSVVRVFASPMEPSFIAYIGESNVLYIHSIRDHK